MMKNEVERSSHVIGGGIESSGDLFGRATARIQSWFRPSLYSGINPMNRVSDEGRGAVQGLRMSTMGDVSLEDAFAALRDEFTPRSGVRFRVFVSRKPKSVRPDIKEQIYLIGREALVNALRPRRAASKPK